MASNTMTAEELAAKDAADRKAKREKEAAAEKERDEIDRKNAERVDLSEVVSPEGPDDLLDDEDLFDEEDDLEDFWDAPNAPDAW